MSQKTKKIIKSEKGSEVMETVVIFPVLLMITFLLFGSISSMIIQRKTNAEIENVIRGQTINATSTQNTSTADGWSGNGIITSTASEAAQNIADGVTYLNSLDGVGDACKGSKIEGCSEKNGKKYAVYYVAILDKKTGEPAFEIHNDSSGQWDKDSKDFESQAIKADKSQVAIMGSDIKSSEDIKNCWKIGNVFEMKAIRYVHEITDNKLLGWFNGFRIWDGQGGTYEIISTVETYSLAFQIENQ